MHKHIIYVFKYLQPGGEFYFSDVYADRLIPKELQEHKVLWGQMIYFFKFQMNFLLLLLIGECLSGAIRESDLISAALNIGFTKPILVTEQPIGVDNKELEKLIGQIEFLSFEHVICFYSGDIKFTSCTYRLFKNKSIEDNQFGAFVTYQTPIIHSEQEFQFDQSITFKVQISILIIIKIILLIQLNGQSEYLNSELTKILRISRYNSHFKFDPVTDEKVKENKEIKKIFIILNIFSSKFQI